MDASLQGRAADTIVSKQGKNKVATKSSLAAERLFCMEG